LELERRNQYVEAKKLHYDHAATNGLARDSARLCMEDVVTLIRRPVAIVDAGDLCLAPGERAIVPARWDRKVPEEDFWCEESSLSGVTVQAGLCAENLGYTARQNLEGPVRKPFEIYKTSQPVDS
jgi:hypothetical protein